MDGCCLTAVQGMEAVCHTVDGSRCAQQQDFISATIPELAQLLSAPAPNPVMSDWEARASKVFSRAEASRLFAMIGPPEPPEGLPLPPDAIPN